MNSEEIQETIDDINRQVVHFQELIKIKNIIRGIHKLSMPEVEKEKAITIILQACMVPHDIRGNSDQPRPILKKMEAPPMTIPEIISYYFARVPSHYEAQAVGKIVCRRYKEKYGRRPKKQYNEKSFTYHSKDHNWIKDIINKRKSLQTETSP